MCTYNRRHLLERALTALFNQNFPKDQYEIVLVDDGSTDGTGDYVKTLDPPCKLTYIYQKNSGLAKGRNEGIRHANGHVILFIDDDIVASPYLLAEHVRTHDRYMDHVVRGWVNHTDDLDNITRPHYNLQDFSTAFFWTSNVSASRKHLLQAGLFDEDFREYGWEDLELGMRLKRLGLGMKYNKKAIVYHYKARWTPADVERLCKQAQAKARTAVIFVDKHPTWRVRLATGLHGPRLLAHRILSVGGLMERFYHSMVFQDNNETLSGFRLVCAQQLVIYVYFQTIIDCLHERRRSGGSGLRNGAGRHDETASDREISHKVSAN